MKKDRIFSFAASLCVFVLAFAFFSCSSGDSVTGSTDINSLVENNPGGLNFIMEFDGDMDTSYPPGTMVAAISESFLSPPVAQAFAPFDGCVYFSNLPATTQLLAAYWIRANALLFVMGPANHGTVKGMINRDTCSDASKFRAGDGSIIPGQNFTFNHNGASTLDTIPQARFRVSY